MINFKVVNAGRRPIVLTLIQGIYENNHKCSQFIDFKNKGLKLEEGELFEYCFGKHDGIMICDPKYDDDSFDLINLWVVDSTNKKYKIKDVKKNIQKLKSSKHPFGVL